jgi:hypothetical protein
MQPSVPVPPGSTPLPLYNRYGPGLLEIGTPAGRLVGHAGGIPGYLSMVLCTRDGRRQLGVMSDVLVAPDPVYEAFMRVFRELSFTRRKRPRMTERVSRRRHQLGAPAPRPRHGRDRRVHPLLLAAYPG